VYKLQFFFTFINYKSTQSIALQQHTPFFLPEFILLTPCSEEWLDRVGEARAADAWDPTVHPQSGYPSQHWPRSADDNFMR